MWVSHIPRSSLKNNWILNDGRDCWELWDEWDSVPAATWLHLQEGWRGGEAKLKERGKKTIANDYDSRKNVIRALSSYQREKLVVVRGWCSHQKASHGGNICNPSSWRWKPEDQGFKIIPGVCSKLSVSGQTRVPSFSKHSLSSATFQTVPGPRDSERKVVHLCSGKALNLAGKEKLKFLNKKNLNSPSWILL